MTANDDELRAGVAELATETGHDGGRSADGRHAAVEELADYIDGSLDAARAIAVRDHLIDCPHCTDRLLDLEAFRQAEEGVAVDGSEPKWDLARAESWRRIRANLPPDGPLAGRAGAWIWPWLALAGGAGLLLLLALLVLRRS